MDVRVAAIRNEEPYRCPPYRADLDHPACARQACRPSAPWSSSWTPFRSTLDFITQQAYTAMQTAAHPLVYGDTLPAAAPRHWTTLRLSLPREGSRHDSDRPNESKPHLVAEGDVLERRAPPRRATVVVKSPPGAGKTRLVETVTSPARAPWCLRVACGHPRAEQSYDFRAAAISSCAIRVELLQHSKRRPGDLVNPWAATS